MKNYSQLPKYTLLTIIKSLNSGNSLAKTVRLSGISRSVIMAIRDKLPINSETF